MARQVGKRRPAAGKSGNSKNKNIKTEITAILIIAFGVLVGISMFTSVTGLLGSWIKTALLGLLGLPAYLLCFAALGCTIHHLAKRDMERYGLKYILVFVLILCLSVLWHIVSGADGNPWELGVKGVGGGLLGGLIAAPVLKLLDFWGSLIVLVAALLILVISIFEISLYKPLKSLWLKIAAACRRPKRKTMPKESAVPEDEPPFDVDEPILAIHAEEPPVQAEVQATQEPDTEAIHQAIEAAEHSLLPKKRKAQEPEPVEIEIENDRVDYRYPSLSLLQQPVPPSPHAEESLQRTARKLIETLHSFGVEAKIVDYSKGPTITRYELQPNEGVKISKITNLADDIALNLAAVGIRIEPIPGKTAIGIEVPNDVPSAVNIREVIGSAEFTNFNSKLAFALGKDIAGKPVVGDIARMPHLLIAGSTGSGKSVCINVLITSILYKATPNEVKLVLIDPKAVELGVYNGIPHLLIPVVTDPRKAAGALQWAVNEMTNRYKLFAETNVRNLKGYNAWAREHEEQELPQIVIIIDELADLMMVAPNDVEDSICRLAQLARAAGMHLVVATQRPSVDVITGIIKANVPSRIAFAVRQYVDSKTIIDMAGAEKLLGKGDMLYYPIGTAKPIRVQGAFVSDHEVEKIVEFVKGQNEAEYDQDVIEKIESAGEQAKATSVEERGGDADELLPRAVEMAIEAGQASVAMYQRHLKVGYQRAAKLIDQMEARGIIGPFDGTKPREVLVTKAQWDEMLMDMDAGSPDAS